MKELSEHIKTFMLALVCILCMPSCIYDQYADEDSLAIEAEDPDKALFVLHISPVNTRGDLPDDGVAEKIKSLRVIAIGRDENGKDILEINRLINFEDVVSNAFGYSFTWATTAGNKDFYIIANEESACNAEDGTISFLENKQPSWITQSITLKKLLDHYKATESDNSLIVENGKESSPNNGYTDYNNTVNNTEDEAANAAAQEAAKEAARKAAAEFKEVIKAVYFAPKYEPKETATTAGSKGEGSGGGNENGITRREIFLPYTTCYENIEVKSLEKNGGKANNQTMYLVPVATKFFFKFVNNRDGDIELWNVKIGGELKDQDGTIEGAGFELDDKDKVMIGGLNKTNFLMAAINDDSEDYNKKFADDNQEYYWVDWLAMVSAKSHQNIGSEGENITFNEKYGWISHYGMPKSQEDDAAVWILADKTEAMGNYPTVKGTKNEPNNDNGQRELTMGPYYMPESKYEYTYQKEVSENNKTVTTSVTEQRYLLNLYLHDASSASNTGVIDFEMAEPIGNVGALFRNTYVIIVVTMAGGIDLDIYAEMMGWNVNKVYGVLGH